MSEKRGVEKGRLLHQVSLAPFTSWRIGGPAGHLYWPHDLNDLQNFLRTVPAEEPLTWLGLGSNILVRDGGIPGTVIITQGVLKNLSRQSELEIYAEAGLSCAQVARFSAKQDLVGGAFLAGIPGTVGGALSMNAGAFGGETWSCVASVKLLNRTGEILIQSADAFTAGYRTLVGLPDDHWFVAANFVFQPGPGEGGFAEIKQLLAKRAATQPTGEPSCGSVFRNSEGQHAAQLIESLGLKGFTVGQAQISEKHANFIINQGGASAKAVEALIAHIQDKVQVAYGITLKPEVRILGVD